MDLCRKKKFGDHSHGIVQIAVKSPLDIKIPAARSRWNAQNAMRNGQKSNGASA